MIYHGDCLEVLKTFEADSIDALVTDPPAGISFMGKEWDSSSAFIRRMTDIFDECIRVMRPGAHGFVWALPRTSHWTATALEDAGFEIRDVVTHLFGSGFPKSLDISKAIDKQAGVEREILSTITRSAARRLDFRMDKESNITAPATREAKQWQGWGTALKPASEHWILVRKPISEKTVAANVLRWSCGGLNIDRSRIESVRSSASFNQRDISGGNYNSAKPGVNRVQTQPENLGRFPSNLILDESAAQMLDEQSGILTSGAKKRDFETAKTQGVTWKFGGSECESSQGGASRFFLCVKHDIDESCGSEKTKVGNTFVGKKMENKSVVLNTDGSGNNLSDQYLMDSMFIIRTEIVLTMSFQILNASIKTPIGHCTIKTEKIIELFLAENVVGVSIVSNTEALIYLENGQQVPIKGIVEIVPVKNFGNGENKTRNITTLITENIELSGARFRYCPKTSKSERNAGCEGLEEKRTFGTDSGDGLGRGISNSHIPNSNHHPTVKPKKLMSYLINMICPPGGTVLDPFMGSGSTGVACGENGFQFIGIEKELEYFNIAEKRIKYTQESCQKGQLSL